jgi:hypothetical protein
MILMQKVLTLYFRPESVVVKPSSSACAEEAVDRDAPTTATVLTAALSMKDRLQSAKIQNRQQSVMQSVLQ